MIKIDQRIVDKGKGDCTRACVVSILELDIDSVTNFIELGGDWFNPFWKFLHNHGCEYYGTGWIKSDGRPHGLLLAESPNIDGLVVASVPSSLYEGIDHSVVMDLEGLIVHDPNPNKAWQDKNVVQSGHLQHWMMIGRQKDNWQKDNW